MQSNGNGMSFPVFCIMNFLISILNSEFLLFLHGELEDMSSVGGASSGPSLLRSYCLGHSNCM
jgi:hypothetical protein